MVGCHGLAALCFIQEDEIGPVAQFNRIRRFLQTVGKAILAVVFEFTDKLVIDLYPVFTDAVICFTIVDYIDHSRPL